MKSSRAALKERWRVESSHEDTELSFLHISLYPFFFFFFFPPHQTNLLPFRHYLRNRNPAVWPHFDKSKGSYVNEHICQWVWGKKNISPCSMWAYLPDGGPQHRPPLLLGGMRLYHERYRHKRLGVSLYRFEYLVEVGGPPVMCVHLSDPNVGPSPVLCCSVLYGRTVPDNRL